LPVIARHGASIATRGGSHQAQTTTSWGVDKHKKIGRLWITKEKNGMMIYPTQNDYRQYFATMSKELLSVWIEVAERKLPNYTRIEEVETVKAALIAARCALAAR